MKTTNGYKIFTLLNKVFMVFFSAVTVFPYMNVLAKALNDGQDTMLGGLTVYPRIPTLENIGALLRDSSISTAAFLSVARVMSGTLLALIVQFAAGYAFTRKSLKGRKTLLLFLIIPMYFSGGLIPVYLLYSHLKLLNNFLVYVVPTAFSFYNMIIIKTYLNSIPESLEESAKLDGANEITIFLRIIIPLSLPIVATIALWTAVYHWNDWVTTLYYTTKPRLYTLQYILMQIIKENERLASMVEAAYRNRQAQSGNIHLKVTPEAIKAAQVVVTTLPIILLYPFLQKYFIKGVMIGAIKD